MNGKMKLMIGGLVLGILLIFAFVGVKSMFGSNNQQPLDTSGWEPPAVTYSPGNIPTIDTNDGKMASSYQDIAPPTAEALKPELINEPPVPEPVSEKPVKVEPDEVPIKAEPTEIPVQPKLAEIPEPTPAPVTASTGQLEIVTQTAENGRALKATVSVQRANGTPVDKATNAATAAFTLKPGTYKITARAEGYASVTRNVTVPANAVVNEIFPLPKIVLATPEPVRPAPVVQPSPGPVATPQAPVMGNGKLRVIALSADDGSPLQVDFTIKRRDGSTLEHLENVAMGELSLPAQEVIVSFNFRGLRGQEPLVIQPGQTTTHTFNIREVSNPAPAALPPQQPQPQIQQQPMSPEDIIRQRIQEEILKRIQ